MIIMTFQIAPVFLACLIWGIITAALAKKKRRSVWGWFVLGFCLWLFPLLVLPFLRKLPRPEFDVAVFPRTNFPNTDFPDTSLSNSRFL
jgi:energy-coupling factor transporter transmembrane protein EcfT